MTAQIIDGKQQKALGLLKEQSLPENNIHQLWASFHKNYFLQTDATTIAHHTQLILQRSATENTIIDVGAHHHEGGTEIFIYTPAQTNCFAISTTVLANLNISIFDARMSNTKDGFAMENYVVLDHHNEPIREPHLLDYIKSELKKYHQYLFFQ